MKKLLIIFMLWATPSIAMDFDCEVLISEKEIKIDKIMGWDGRPDKKTIILQAVRCENDEVVCYKGVSKNLKQELRCKFKEVTNER